MLKALDLWLPAWLNRKPSPPSPGVRHLLLCVCDHFEPFHRVGKPEAVQRVELWKREFTRICRETRDGDGVPPRHTFFYPIEQYDETVVGKLAELCHETGSDTEIHLHHDRDNAEHMTETLALAKSRLSDLGLLCRDPEGAIRYGFIHGNWALDHSHPEGLHCGVRNELATLRESGCYADFTLPSAPSRTQTKTINSLYYARGTEAPKSHDAGRRVYVRGDGFTADQDELLLVQGPLALNWATRKWGLLPRIENSDLTGANPPTETRLQLWMDCHITVESRPDWIFVKLHTHGAKPENSRMFLGEPMQAFHRLLAEKAASDANFRYHYVSARELVNILHAAEAGHSGDPSAFRDFRYRRLSAPAPAVA